jgi:hypothetical protein
MDTETTPPPAEEIPAQPPPPPEQGPDRWEQALAYLSERVNPWVLGILAVVLLLGAHGVQHLLRERVATLQTRLHDLHLAEEQSALAASHFQTLSDLKNQDVDQFKEGMSTLAQSSKALFEAGLSVQEEKRLLEKQWEIMTTYLTIDMAVQRIFLMRGDQPLESYYLNYIPLKAFAGAPVTLPRTLRIVSKERFANPERGSSEVINGKLQWEPPQVGTSIRSNALGQYVLFTNSKLILHGPPNNAVDHEAFPHICLGLTLEAARNLYQHSFVGTKILLPAARADLVQAVALPTAFEPGTTTQAPHGN